jgi:rRNA maturation protein Nop10
MSTTSETKCSRCGLWQIKMRFCPSCGHEHSADGYYGDASNIYTVTVKMCPFCNRYHDSKIACDRITYTEVTP